jgi:DNA invertase Pin-like site-specific DNA recombinase
MVERAPCTDPRGDTLMVTRIDRLARSMKDLQDIVHEFDMQARGGDR